MNKRYFYILSTVLSVFVAIAVFVFAYGSNDPTVLGHSSGELEVTSASIVDGSVQAEDIADNSVNGSKLNIIGCDAGYSIRNFSADGIVECELDTDTNTWPSEDTVEGYIVNDISTGYIPRDNGNEFENTPIYSTSSSGNIGIGTTGTSAKLDVVTGSGTAIEANGESKGMVASCTGNNCDAVQGSCTVSGCDGVSGVGSSGTSTGVRGQGGQHGGHFTGSNYGVIAYGSGDGVWASGTTNDFYAGGPGTNYAPFTGAHDAKLSSDFPNNVKPGMIVSVTGTTEKRIYEGEITISTTLPTVKLSSSINDKKVLGVYVHDSEPDDQYWYLNQTQEGDRFASINALGEGRVWVTDINGEVQAGDYITTSEVPGYGMKQDDDLLHSYTLGKAIETIDWNSVTDTITHNNKQQKAYLIGVVYTSG